MINGAVNYLPVDCSSVKHSCLYWFKKFIDCQDRVVFDRGYSSLPIGERKSHTVLYYQNTTSQSSQEGSRSVSLSSP